MSAISGQNTIAAAGTAEALGSQIINGPLMVKALDGNAGNVYVGNNGSNDVASTNGIVLAPGDAIVFEYVYSLGHIYLDAANNDDGAAWLMLSV